MKDKIFEIIKSESKEYWLELRGCDGCYEVKGNKRIPIWNIHVICKWDGCIDYRSYSNGYGYDHECKEDCQCYEDYIHICSVDGMIDRLKEVKDIGVEYYKDKSGSEYWEKIKS